MEQEFVKVLKETLSSCFNKVVDVTTLGDSYHFVYDLDSIAESDTVYYSIVRMPWHQLTERSLHIMVRAGIGFSGACVSWLLEDLPCSSLVHIDCKEHIMDMYFHINFK